MHASLWDYRSKTEVYSPFEFQDKNGEMKCKIGGKNPPKWEHFEDIIQLACHFEDSNYGINFTSMTKTEEKLHAWLAVKLVSLTSTLHGLLKVARHVTCIKPC